MMLFLLPWCSPFISVAIAKQSGQKLCRRRKGLFLFTSAHHSPALRELKKGGPACDPYRELAPKAVYRNCGGCCLLAGFQAHA